MSAIDPLMGEWRTPAEPEQEPDPDRDGHAVVDRPRERLRSLGAISLSDEELVALILATGARNTPVVELAGRLLKEGGGLRRMSARSVGELERYHGLGPAKASRVAAAFEMGRRVAQLPLRAGASITSAADVAAHFGPHLRDRKQEVFLTLLLDGRRRLLRAARVAEGCLTAALVHPREALRPGVLEAAAAVIFVHNHPSGDPTPSPEDLDLTHQLVQAADILAIEVLDHVIVGDDAHTSLLAEGLLRPEVALSGAPREPCGDRSDAPLSARSAPRARRGGVARKI